MLCISVVNVGVHHIDACTEDSIDTMKRIEAARCECRLGDTKPVQWYRIRASGCHLASMALKLLALASVIDV